MEPKDRIIVPLDTSSPREFDEALFHLSGQVGVFKVGYQAGYGIGWGACHSALNRYEAAGFYDVKLHDIPNTMAEAAKSIEAQFRPWAINVHASAGIPAMKAVMDALPLPRPNLVFAVSVLTSLHADTIVDLYRCERTLGDVFNRLFDWSREAGVDGVICSPLELPLLKQRWPEALAVVPGVRPKWASTDDQARVATPREAVDEGADYLVIGRPILKAPEGMDMRTAAQRIVEEIS